MIQKSTIQFLKELNKNNYREWFNENKPRYEAAKENVIEVVAELIKEINKFEPSLGYPEPKKCLFRIYRDVRFSKNKEPYKTNMGAIIGPEGNTKTLKSGYYLHIEPGSSFVSCGVYMPLPPVVKAIRTAIDEDFGTFRTIINNKTFKKYFDDLSREDDALQRVPPGFDKNSPAAEYLKLKNFYVFYQFTDKELESEDFAKNAAKVFKATKPFNDWLNAIIEDVEF
ncbi:MAG: DUF2461 domain-containing protein [Prevotellaceae bacterium]|jgi:uncharacterized protein (TIGR02453 family)|nr:DUF2461 domain-containing protein [Prevotellaceae bacterium]